MILIEIFGNTLSGKIISSNQKVDHNKTKKPNQIFAFLFTRMALLKFRNASSNIPSTITPLIINSILFLISLFLWLFYTLKKNKTNQTPILIVMFTICDNFFILKSICLDINPFKEITFVLYRVNLLMNLKTQLLTILVFFLSFGMQELYAQESNLNADELFQAARKEAFDNKNYPAAVNLAKTALAKSP